MKLFRLDVPVNQKREMTWILSNIAAGSHRQIDLLFETNDIVEMLINAFYSDDHRIRKVNSLFIRISLFFKILFQNKKQPLFHLRERQKKK